MALQDWAFIGVNMVSTFPAWTISLIKSWSWSLTSYLPFFPPISQSLHKKTQTNRPSSGRCPRSTAWCIVSPVTITTSSAASSRRTAPSWSRHRLTRESASGIRTPGSVCRNYSTFEKPTVCNGPEPPTVSLMMIWTSTITSDCLVECSPGQTVHNTYHIYTPLLLTIFRSHNTEEILSLYSYSTSSLVCSRFRFLIFALFFVFKVD